MVDLAVLPTSCWSDEYLLSHCEGYRVVDETGEPIGLIDRVLWPEDHFGAAAALVVAQPNDGGDMQGTISGPVSAPVQSVAVGLSRGCGDRCDTAQVGERSFAAQPVGVVPDGDQ